MRLSERDKSRARFHLGFATSTGIDEGDVRQVEQSFVTIKDYHIFIMIVLQLNRCDAAYAKTDMTGEPAIDKLVYVGDLNRAKAEFRLSQAARDWEEVYLMEVDKLAQILWVPNYRRPEVETQRRQRAGTVYVQPIPGPADTAIISQHEALILLSGGSGF